jgi:hypothetical protein
MTTPNVPQWTITGQRLDTELSDTGTGFTPVWRVSYKVTSGPATGTTGYINVPADQHNADTVAKAVSAAVYNLDKVAGL